MRASETTLGREVDLIAAYLDVLRVRMGEPAPVRDRRRAGAARSADPAVVARDTGREFDQARAGGLARGRQSLCSRMDRGCRADGARDGHRCRNPGIGRHGHGARQSSRPAARSVWRGWPAWRWRRTIRRDWRRRCPSRSTETSGQMHGHE
ncbi:MAG: hypothetical protein MZV70_42940 [Desulfobacterales bacterium]|nr:hypothetical protein [Desulfobacterales bacterium]